MTEKLSIAISLDVNPAEGQSAEEAREEVLRAFQDYFEGPDSPFVADHVTPDGLVEAVTSVDEVEYDFNTAAAMLDMHPSFLVGAINRGELPITEDYHVRHADLADYKARRDAGRRLVEEALNDKEPGTSTLRGL